MPRCFIVEAGFLSYTTTGSPTITTDGDYKVLKWTSNGSISFTDGSSTVASLVVGGGAGGEGDAGAGGGGGGGVIYTSPGNIYSLADGTKTITIGSGGINTQNGGNSVFDLYTAIGGGYSNQAGGSGGGGKGDFVSGGAGTGGQGYAGGKSGHLGDANVASGGGGGGAGGVGSDGTDSPDSGATGGDGGNGGAPLNNSITGTSRPYGSGGAGVHGVGYSSNGGDGTSTPSDYGQGGDANPAGGSSGQNGVVILRIKFQ